MLARSGAVDICVSWVIVACMAKQCEGMMSADTKAQTQRPCCQIHTGPYVDKYGILPCQEIAFVRAMCGGSKQGVVHKKNERNAFLAYVRPCQRCRQSPANPQV